ncbi:MAG: HIT domain-containing protein [Planctomycetaceae bacterium]
MTNEQLWAPWRLSYILNNKESVPATESGGCFLCRYRDQANDVDNFVVARGESAFVVLNRFPYNNGHLLIAPLAHKASLVELDDGELLDCMRQLQKLMKVYSEILTPDGFNVGLNLGRVAGAGVPGHLHWHLVPRWQGDTSFMPILGETNVISQSLQELYRYLTDALSRS